MSTVTQNNLGGSGPDAGAEELRFSGIGIYQGASLDIVVRVKAGADYRTNDENQEVNGMLCVDEVDPSGNPQMCSEKGSIGQINLCAGCRGNTVGEQTEVSMTIERTDTKTAIALPGFYISFFDIDMKVNPGGLRCRELISVSGYSKAVYDETNTEAKFVEVGNTLTATSTKAGATCDNPKDIRTLTTIECEENNVIYKVDQSLRSVMFLFRDTSSFDVHLETIIPTKTKQIGRNFLFAFKSGKVDDC